MYWMCKVFCRLFQAMIFKLLLIQKGVSTCIANVDTPFLAETAPLSVLPGSLIRFIRFIRFIRLL